MTPLYIIENGIKQYDFKRSLQYLQHLGKQKYGASFKIHKEDLPIIYKLLIYFIQDEENCSEQGIDLKKGILLNGPVGCGKTSLMTLCKYFTHAERTYAIMPTRTIAAEYKKDGQTVLYKYGKLPKIYCFDDLGIEQPMKHFGNESNTIAEVLLYRYDLMLGNAVVTHATTNLNADELEKLYGNRVRSRLRSMFNLVAFGRDVGDKRK